MKRAFTDNGNLVLREDVRAELLRLLNGNYVEGQGNAQYHAIKHLKGVCPALSIDDCRAVVECMAKRKEHIDNTSREFGLKEKKLNPTTLHVFFGVPQKWKTNYSATFLPTF